MKANKILIAMGMGSMLLCGSVFASPTIITPQTGTVTFDGVIVNQPCSIDSDSQNLTVPMGYISTQELLTGTKESTPQPFNIKLHNCFLTGSGQDAVTISFSGTKVEGNDHLLAITGEAQGAGIKISALDGSKAEKEEGITLGQQSSAIKLNGSKGIGSSFDQDLHFSAVLKGFDSYDEKHPLKAGSFIAVANFVLNYQ